jgi:ribosomal protein L29
MRLAAGKLPIATEIRRPPDRVEKERFVTKVAEYRDQSVDQLSDQLGKLKKEAVQFTLPARERPIGGIRERVRTVRRDIARILTVLGQRGRRPYCRERRRRRKLRRSREERSCEYRYAGKKPAKRARAKKEMG